MRHGTSTWICCLRELIREDDGQDLAEYGIALAVIALGTILLALAIGTDVQSLWSNAQPKLRSVIDAEP